MIKRYIIIYDTAKREVFEEFCKAKKEIEDGKMITCSYDGEEVRGRLKIEVNPCYLKTYLAAVDKLAELIKKYPD